MLSELECRSAFASNAVEQGQYAEQELSWAIDGADYWPIAYVVWALSEDVERIRP